MRALYRARGGYSTAAVNFPPLPYGGVRTHGTPYVQTLWGIQRQLHHEKVWQRMSMRGHTMYRMTLSEDKKL